MPELPEVETVRRQLDLVLAGKEIDGIDVLREKSFNGEASRVIGAVIESVERKGKVLAIRLYDDKYLLVHLKMTGQLVFVGQEQRVVGGHPTQDWVNVLPSKHTRVVIGFSDDSKLYFNDQRVFGWVKVATRDEWNEVRGRMPPDVIDPEFTVDYLHRVLQRSRRPVKLVVMDSSLIGGVGNIYANDALYISRIHPNTPAYQVKYDAVINLHTALIQVISRGIETGGASYSHFVDSSGMGGNYQKEFRVYDKEGQECVECHEKILKIKLGGRGTYFCPKCQSE